MAKRLSVSIVAILVCTSFAGCGGSRVARDPVFATKLLKSVYGGSLAPVNDSLHRYYRRQSPDWLIAGLGELLDHKYGGVRELVFQSSLELQRGAISTTWRVDGEKGNYEMKIAFDRSGKVLYMAFRPTAHGRWTPAVQMAREYIHQQMTKTHTAQP